MLAFLFLWHRVPEQPVSCIPAGSGPVSFWALSPDAIDFKCEQEPSSPLRVVQRLGSVESTAQWGWSVTAEMQNASGWVGGRCRICCYSPLGLDVTLVVLKREDDETAAGEISQLTAEVNHRLCSQGNSKLFYFSIPNLGIHAATVSV